MRSAITVRKNLHDTHLYLEHKNVVVQSLDSSASLDLSFLKKENKKYHREWLIERSEATDKTKVIYGIFLHDELVGEVSLRDFTYFTCQVAYWIDKKHWGQGMATTAVRLITNFALENLNVLEVHAYVHVANSLSTRVLKKAGYTEADVTYKKMFYSEEEEPHLMYICDTIFSG